LVDSVCNGKRIKGLAVGSGNLTIRIGAVR
jgi:hypothetical protein